MNVLNVEDIERELRIYATRALSEHAHRWVMTVARNYILGKLPEKDVLANFREICLCKFILTRPGTQGKKHDPAKHDPKELPHWAVAAIERGETLLWFDPIQCRRRAFWSVLEIIMIWFNSWKRDDTRFRRADRISFPVATDAAVLWYKNVSENIWNYVSDKPILVKEYDHGFRWVKLVSALQFEREGHLMDHCVGNGAYFTNFQSNRTTYFSLRDSQNKPHATMEVSFNGGHPLNHTGGAVLQCKGHGNRKADKAYQPYIRRFITDMEWTINGDKGLIDPL